jgi:hypothetical protein
MPIKVSYREDGGVDFDEQGLMTGEDVIEANNTIYASEEKIAQLKYQLCDYTKVDKFEISNFELRRIASQDEKAATLNPDMLVAIVSVQDLMFGLARMWEAYAGETPFETAVFREREEAKAWIQARVK